MNYILCPGEILIDFISVEHGKKLADVNRFSKKAGGAPANAAMAMNRFGAEAIIVGTVGSDAFGDFLVKTLEENGLESGYVKRSGKATTLAFVSLDEVGERSFEFIRGADEDLKKEDVPVGMMEKAGIYHFSSATAFLGGNLEKTYHHLLGNAREHGKIISFDPNYRDALFDDKKDMFIDKSREFIKYSDILKVSDEEALLISGRSDMDSAVDYFLGLGAKNVFLTLGEKGCLYATPDKREIIPSISVDVVDTTGAGDAFIGALLGQISGLAREDLTFDVLKEVVRKANVAAALTTTNRGALTSLPDEKKVDEYMGS